MVQSLVSRFQCFCPPWLSLVLGQEPSTRSSIGSRRVLTGLVPVRRPIIHLLLLASQKMDPYSSDGTASYSSKEGTATSQFKEGRTACRKMFGSTTDKFGHQGGHRHLIPPFGNNFQNVRHPHTLLKTKVEDHGTDEVGVVLRKARPTFSHIL